MRARAAQIANFHWKGLLREDLPTKPIISAVEGYAVAGGTELLVGTDLRVVAESATLGLFEAKRALFPMGGSADPAAPADPLLPRHGPPAHRPLRHPAGGPGHGPGQPRRPGRPGPGGGARDRRPTIAASGPLAVQAILRTYRDTLGLPEPDALKISDELGWPVIGSEDAKEGTRAFQEKRPPTYQGH